MSKYRVCHNCACAISYADTSGMDGEILANFNKFTNAVGPLADNSRPVTKKEREEEFQCAACFQAVDQKCDEKHIYEQVVFK